MTGLVDPDPTDPYQFQLQYNPTNVTLQVINKLTQTTPTVTSVSPYTGTTAGGNSVYVAGTNFSDTSSVDFGNTPASSFTVSSATLIRATAPPAPAGTVDVVVTTPGGSSSTSSADQYRYTAAPVPTVTGVSPSGGDIDGGTQVTITGTRFTGATGVTFGTLPATEWTFNSDTSMTAVAPPAAAGTVDVQVSTFSGTSATSSADQFTYSNVPTPVVSSVSPAYGSTGGGTVVSVIGSGFTNADGVFFGSVAASSFTKGSDSSISATAPPEAAGTVDVTVTAYGNVSAASSGDRFTYNSAAAPAVTGVSPSSGSTAGGTVVTITGTGFIGANSVMFGTTAAGNVAANSDTQITAVAPAQAAGIVDVTVTTPTGTSAVGSADQFTYTAAAAPSVTSVSPNSGSTAGGTTVTISGSNFTGGIKGTFLIDSGLQGVTLDRILVRTMRPAAGRLAVWNNFDKSIFFSFGCPGSLRLGIIRGEPRAIHARRREPSSAAAAGGGVAALTNRRKTAADVLVRRKTRRRPMRNEQRTAGHDRRSARLEGHGPGATLGAEAPGGSGSSEGPGEGL